METLGKNEVIQIAISVSNSIFDKIIQDFYASQMFREIKLATLQEIRKENNQT